jgi:CheY-like chemotaxis protein
MDLHMPELDGAEAANRIRTALGDSSPPILALTADVFGRSEIAGAEDQFDDWLLKPIDAVLLGRRLAELLRHDTRQERQPDVQTGAPRIPLDLQRRYAQEIRRLLAEMRSATQSGDQTTLRGALHNLKGLVGLLGYPALQQLVAHLDTDHLAAEALDGQIAVLEHKIRQVLEDALPDVG